MNKNILMIYPEIPTTYWSFKYTLPFIKKRAAIPPLGLMTIAAMLPDNYDVKLIDMNISDLGVEDILEADLIFISAMIIQNNSFDSVVKLCNEHGVPVVAGGPYPTSSYEKISGVDHFVLNEAEYTLPEFIKDYEKGTPKKMYQDSRKPDITQTPAPRFDLVEVDAYTNMALQYSRGCPFKCEFCDIIEMFGRVPRTKTPDQFIREMDAAYQTGFRGSLFIVDDNFVGHKKKAKELLRSIIKWQDENDYPFQLFTEASIDLAQDDELLNLMKQAGFDMAFIGIETPDKVALEAAQKNQNLKTDLSESIEKIQRSGIEVTGGFIVGFDTDTEDIFDRQIEFIQNAGIPIAMVGLLIALPNTQLFRRLKKEGRLRPINSTGNNTNDLQTNFTPTMPEDILVKGYKHIISSIYSPKNYFDRCLTVLRRMPSGRVAEKPITLLAFRAFLLSLAKQIFSSYGHHYLRFLFNILKYNRTRFPDAITLSVKGHHFFKMTKEILKADEFSAVLSNAIQYFQERIANIDTERVNTVATEIEKHLIQLKRKLGRKYNNLNHGVQEYLNVHFAEFEDYCENMIIEMKQLCLQEAV